MRPSSAKGNRKNENESEVGGVIMKTVNLPVGYSVD